MTHCWAVMFPPRLALIRAKATLTIEMSSVIRKNPIEAIGFLMKGAFGSKTNLANTVVRAMPLIFTGLCTCFAYRCGVFNLGGEGQFLTGAMAAITVTLLIGHDGWWVTILFLIREIGITVMRFFVMERPGGKVIAAAWPGKLKTVFQCVGLSMLLLPFWSLGNGQATPFWMTAYYFLTYAIIYVALVLCLYSGAVYLYNTFVAPKRK